MSPVLENHRADLADLCRRYGVKRLAVFGSAARGDFDPERSDVDLLVEFGDTVSPGYADRFLDFAMEAEKILGRSVDLVTQRSVVNPFFAREVFAEQVELYAA